MTIKRFASVSCQSVSKFGKLLYQYILFKAIVHFQRLKESTPRVCVGDDFHVLPEYNFRQILRRAALIFMRLSICVTLLLYRNISKACAMRVDRNLRNLKKILLAFILFFPPYFSSHSFLVLN